jgi:hypothetical protein
MNILSVGAELINGTDGQTHRPTDVTKLMVTFLNFANVPKNCNKIHIQSLVLI